MCRGLVLQGFERWLSSTGFVKRRRNCAKNQSLPKTLALSPFWISAFCVSLSVSAPALAAKIEQKRIALRRRLAEMAPTRSIAAGTMVCFLDAAADA